MAKYVPVTDYETARGYNRAGLLYWRSQSGEWHSTSKEPGYYDDPMTYKSGQERWSDDIKGGIEHAILVEEDDEEEGSG